ncbi:MAG: leucine-rich repeat domain-containing protein [Zavarzinella sp.]
MNSDSTIELDDPEHKTPASTLTDEAAAAPESAWFFALFKSAMLYLGIVTAYLTALVGLVAIWKEFIAQKDEQANLAIYTIAGILLLPLLLAFLFNLLPASRRRRERSLRPTGLGKTGYFTTAPREDDPYKFFANGYEPFLQWAASPKAPLLYLTGLSGAGKSSLLGAYLKPQLAAEGLEQKTILLTIRSYNDPLASLKEALLVLWKKKPDDYADLTPMAALRRAERQLAADCRLLIAFDQFEEYFLLRGSAARGENQPLNSTETTIIIDESTLTPIRDFLKDFLTNPPGRTTILLSYRDDHHRLLAPLQLPVREEGKNWMTIEPLDFATAAKFLRSCPGLNVPEERMKHVLHEAARQEGSRVVMRPIVANFLGLILQRMSNHPLLWRRTDDLLRGYVRDCLGDEIKEERGRVLRALLTDFHTARPRSVSDIAQETGLETTALDVQLEQFGHAGLVRCVSADAADHGRRVFQISHDFLATLIERVLDGMHRTFWRIVRPWLAPTTTVLVIGLVFIFPWVQKQRAIEHLANAGFTWNESTSTITVGTEEGRSIKKLDHLKAAFRRLKPRNLDLSGCKALQNVHGLKGLTSLQTLDLSRRDRDQFLNGPPFFMSLQNVDDLKGLTSLQTLDLSGCASLQNVDGLNGLTSLTTLDLSGCASLQNVDGLNGLTSLQTLDLRDCESLRNVDGLKELTSLRTLDLSDCRSLQNVDGLKELTSLRTLDLSDCRSLQNVDGLEKFTSLTQLELRGCSKLQNVEGFRGLTLLQTLDLKQCLSLENVNGLNGLKSLRNLDLSDCRSLQNVDGLNGLTSLQILDLSGCDSLQNVNGLEKLTALQTLDLSGCDSLQNVNGLEKLTALQTLDLNNCSSLQNVDGLEKLTSLQTLYLSSCDSLQNLNGIEKLTALQTISLGGYTSLQNVNGLEKLTSLQTLYLYYCDSLQNLNGIEKLTALQTLYLSSCDSLQNLNGIEKLTALQTLYLSDCDSLQNLNGLKGLTSLQTLHLNDCDSLQNLNGIEKLTSLRTLDLNNCSSLQNVDVLQGLTSLTTLDLGSCKALKNLNGIEKLTSLRTLDLRYCNSLPRESWATLKTSLPNTKIIFP